MEDQYIFFIVHPGGDKSKIKVVDLANTVSYERDDFSPVNNDDYFELEQALDDAKALAKKYNLEYVLFESRYDSTLNEQPPALTL